MSEGNVVKMLAQDFFNRSLKISLLDSDWKVFTWTKQQNFLEATVKSPLLKKYPVNSEFLSLFFKKIINCLELHGLDIHDGIYDSLCCAMQRKAAEKEFCYRHYIIRHPINNLDDIIVTKETKNIVVNGTTGMRTWEAALMLADWALCNQEVFKNKHVLELGAGVGFTGITIAKHCSTKSILLTDCNTDVLTTINENIIINFPNLKSEDKLSGTVYRSDELNIALMLADWALCNQEVFKNKHVLELGAGVGFTGITIAKHCSTKSILLTDCNTDVLTTINENIIINFPNLKSEDKLSGTVYRSDELNIETMMLDWNNIQQVASDVIPDVLVGADIVYDPSILLPLCKVLQHFIEKNKSLEIYIASVLRNEDTFKSFNSLLSTMGFATEYLDHLPFCITWDSNIERCLLKIRCNTKLSFK